MDSSTISNGTPLTPAATGPTDRRIFTQAGLAPFCQGIRYLILEGSKLMARQFSLRARGALVVALASSLALPPPAVAQQPPAPPAGQQEAPANQKYKIEILSAAGRPQKRKKNVISSESVIRVSDSNDVPVAGIAVMFSLTSLSGGSAAFANGAMSTVITTNAAGLASTGAVSAAATSSFNIAVSASVGGQALTASIPVNMAAVAAGGRVVNREINPLSRWRRFKLEIAFRRLRLGRNENLTHVPTP